jgi:urease accessory protein
MLQVSKLLPRGQGLAPVLLKRAATVSLDWDVRQKSRFDATDSLGRTLGVFLPRGTVVRGGDVLVAEDGSLIRVQAAPQPVLVITHCSQHGSPFDLTRAAYHLGNRHVPIELQRDHLKIEPDHVLADMLRNMHLIVNAQDAAFEPEGGAYGNHGGHGHGPGHGHSHDHGHDHAHGHGDAQGHGHSHAHQAHADPASSPGAEPAPADTGFRPWASGAAPAVAGAAQGAGGDHRHGPGCHHDHDAPHRH